MNVDREEPAVNLHQEAAAGVEEKRPVAGPTQSRILPVTLQPVSNWYKEKMLILN